MSSGLEVLFEMLILEKTHLNHDPFFRENIDSPHFIQFIAYPQLAWAQHLDGGRILLEQLCHNFCVCSVKAFLDLLGPDSSVQMFDKPTLSFHVTMDLRVFFCVLVCFLVHVAFTAFASSLLLTLLAIIWCLQVLWENQKCLVSPMVQILI